MTTHNVTRLRAATAPGGSRPKAVVPWVIAGVAGVAAIVVTIILIVQDPKDNKSEHGKPTADPIAAVTMNVRSMQRSRPTPRRRSASGTSLSGASLAKTTGELLAGCSSPNKATNLFYKANRRRYKLASRAWAKAAFAALLKCRHAIDGQKMWAAFRLTQLHAKDGECDTAARAWRRWILHGGPGKKPLLKRPKCRGM